MFFPLYFFFSRVSRKKYALQTAVMLCMDDALYEGVLMIFDELEVQNSRQLVVKPTFPQNFYSLYNI